MIRTFRFAVPALAILTLIVSPAAGSIVFSAGNNPPSNNVNIDDGTGTTVMGLTTNNVVVNFSSNETLVGSGGQASVQAQDGAINLLTITVPGGSYSKLIIDPQLNNTMADHSVTVDVVGSSTALTSTSLSLSNGSNFLTIEASGETILSVTITDANIGFDKLKQPRIYGEQILPTTAATTTATTTTTTTPTTATTSPTSPTLIPGVDGVPEPLTLALWGGLGGGMYFFRRRKTAA